MLADPARFLRERHAAHGDLWKTRLIVPIVVAVGPGANQSMLVTEREHFSHKHAYGDLAVGRIFAGSLLVKDGAPHKVDRDILQPAVGRLGLGHSIDRVHDIWQRGSADLAARGDVDVYEMARDITFEVSANALVDLELTEMAEWRTLFEGLIDGALANVRTRLPFGRLDRGLKARAALIKKLVPRIEEARHREARGMLGLLAHHKDAEGNPLRAEDIAAHVLLLFWAGYDTTASTGGWALHMLADRPEWQDRLVAESERVLGDRPMTLEDQDALVEHNFFLKEIERLCPVVLFFPRRTTDDVTVHGQAIPRGTMMFWSPYLTHLDPRTFEDPLLFDPMRFSPTRGDRQAKLPYLVGFGAGPRICLGKAFALLQLRVMTTTILRRFRIERVAAGEILALPTHRPKGSIVRFVPR